MYSLRRAVLFCLLIPFSARGAEITGTISEVMPGGGVAKVPARLVIESLDDARKPRFLAISADPTGEAVPLDKKRPDGIAEVHTALSAHPWKANLPPGRYRITASRGHEYRPAFAEITVPQAEPVDLKLERWIDMASRGWYSGDVHCHLPRAGLETVILAADLNVTFPLGGWVTDTTQVPKVNNKVKETWPLARMGIADSRHVFWSANTEYELFTQNGEKNTLGAILVLRHRDPLTLTVPPVTPLLEAARKEGAILDLEKHNWPWSMVLPAIGAVDLFELANNHLWENGFGVTNWYTEYVPDYMGIARTADGKIDERGWLSFGLQNWYALLNCGLKIAPSAGTGAGVHPVAPGFGRVYVRMPGETFDFDEWCKGLKAGRSFVTTGPMLFLTVAEKHPGAKFEWDPEAQAAKGGSDEGDGVPVICRVESEFPIESLEWVVNGEPRKAELGGPIGARAAHSAFVRARLPMERSGWIAARVFAKTADGRPRFAHSAPIYVEVGGRPLRPKVAETTYLLKRVEDEIARQGDALSKEAKAEFEKAAEFYREKQEEAVAAEKRSK